MGLLHPFSGLHTSLARRDSLGFEDLSELAGSLRLQKWAVTKATIRMALSTTKYTRPHFIFRLLNLPRSMLPIPVFVH